MYLVELIGQLVLAKTQVLFAAGDKISLLHLPSDFIRVISVLCAICVICVLCAICVLCVFCVFCVISDVFCVSFLLLMPCLVSSLFTRRLVKFTSLLRLFSNHFIVGWYPGKQTGIPDGLQVPSTHVAPC